MPPRDSRIAEGQCAADTKPAGLDEIVITAELAGRPSPAPDLRAENEKLSALAQAMAGGAENILQTLAEAALDLCAAHSAGISILEAGEIGPVFRWRATAGAFAPLRGQTLPRDFSPCGVVLDRDALQLMRSPVRYYPYIATLAEPVHEVLLAPFHHKGVAVGTVWVAAHKEDKRFDAEDARVTTSLARFAEAAWQIVLAQEEIEATRQALHAQEAARREDRSELAETRERAELAQARFTAFFEQSPFYSGMLATDGRVVEVSRTALETCGYRRDDVLGKLFWETGWWQGSAEAQQRVKEGFAAALRGETFKAELPYYFADRSEHIVDFGLSPVFDTRGQVSFVIATGNDISERVKTERELASARRRVESALIAGELGVYEWEVGSDRLHGDTNFLRLFDVNVDETGCAPLSGYLAVIHPDDRGKTMAAINYSVGTGENFEADYRVMVRGRERWINSRGRMGKNAEGKVVTFFGVVLDITDRKRAEKERERIANELRRLSLVHETVLSAMDDFAYIFNRQGQFLYANRRLLTVWAKTLDEVVGKTWYELGYPTWHADMHMSEIAQVIQTRQSIRGEVPFTGDSGISGVYDYIFTPVLGLNGEVELIAGTTRDVTARRFSEDRDRFLVALDDATRPLTDPLQIVQTSAELLCDYLDVNRCAYADVEADENTFNLTGDYTRDVPTIVGRYRFDQFGDECLRQMRAGEPYIVEDSRTDPRIENVRAAYEATQIRSVICVPLRKAGKFAAAMAVHRAAPRVWKSGEVELVMLVANRCWESIERARVLRALAESEQQLRLAVETGRLGVWQLDLATETFTCSAQCKGNYGRPAGHPFGYGDFWEAIHPEDRERVRVAVQRAIAERGVLDLEYQTVWLDGSVHWVLVRGQVNSAADNTSQRMIGVSLDITERKQAEREIARLHEEAVRGSRAKDDFLAALSHELRTPLNPVLLIASESANDPELPAHVREAFTVIRKNVELEARLIDDLLDLTGIVRGKLVVKKQPITVHDILTEAAATLRGDFAAKDVALELALDTHSHVVDADRVRLLQVFLNLLRNAVKFTPAGGKVSVASRVVDDGTLEIEVADTGLGMTAQELQRAFGAFEQGDHAAASGSHRFGGLGLGLAISRRLVELHSGNIRAASEGRDKGARVTVSLPLTAQGVELDFAMDSAESSQPAGVVARTGWRVLLVEDHEPTRNALRQLLQRRKYQVTAAASVAEARNCAAREPFDFVISDIGLPDGDGASLMAQLRERFGLKGIALTGYGMDHDISRCQAAGFVTHLTKPVRIESLEAALAALTAAGASAGVGREH
jgi:PAS domain S-box-containing protein